jgi:hypothetical protein
MNDAKNKKQKVFFNQANPLESLKDIGGDAVKSLKEDLLVKTPKDFMDQLFGPRQSFSGEIIAGESLEINEVLTGQHKEKQILRQQLQLERTLSFEEKESINRKSNELKIQLKAIQEEILYLTLSTQDLGEETQLAAMQASVEPGIYHLLFFEKLLEFIKSFRKKIEEAGVWLHATNQRAAKKNSWAARYKKHGAKYLLSGEHYLTRSAG